MTITVREAQERDIDHLVDMNRIVHDLHIAARRRISGILSRGP
jgi:hypothetical protein